MYDVVIVGAGVTGSLVAREAARYGLRALVLEKELDVGNGASGANSAIVHSGYDPLPGTRKAAFNVLGNSMYPELCRQLDVKLGKIGSLTIAMEGDDLGVLEELRQRGYLNNVECVIWDQEKLRKEEPNISPQAIGALYCPNAYIVDPFNLTVSAMENAIDNGVELHLGEAFVSGKRTGDHIEVTTERGVYETRFLINCAGVYSDSVSSLLGDKGHEVRPRKGEYYVLDHFGAGFVRHVLFPLPSNKGKGILVTPTTSFNYLVGPSSEWTDEKDDVDTDALTLEKVKEGALRMVPSLPMGQLIRVYAGLRASGNDGDFLIEESKAVEGLINLIAIDSPGLASAPAIAKYVIEELVGSKMKVSPREDFDPCVRKHIHPLALSQEERDTLLRDNPKYGKIVCGCEKVSLGEIEDALNRSVPCLTLKALKKRVRAGFGKCQGSFCFSNTIEILAKHLGVGVDEIPYDKEGSEPCLYEVKA